MIVLLCRNRVADYHAWKRVFDSHEQTRREAGLRLRGLWPSFEERATVFFQFEVADLAG
jgi:hypothetical protein